MEVFYWSRLYKEAFFSTLVEIRVAKETFKELDKYLVENS